MMEYFGLTAAEQAALLRYLVEQAVPESFNEATPVIDSRLNYELKKIEKLNLSAAFLLAKEAVDILCAKDAGRPYAIGPVCGSLVAFALGISRINPLKHGLLFERAVNKYVSAFSVSLCGDADMQRLLFEQLKSRYPETVFKSKEQYRLLTINGIELALHDNPPCDTRQITRDSTLAVYQEDYMRLLHFVGGYDYEEADYIRRCICKRKKDELSRYRADFIANRPPRTTEEESGALLDNIARDLPFATCKAFVLPSLEIIDYNNKKNP